MQQEARNLKRFSEKDHDHLVKLLVTFSRGGSFNMVFPWAKCNLRQFWETQFPDPGNPSRDSNLARWMSAQFFGVANALKKVHFATIESGHPHDVPEDDVEKVHGRHGDVKPENILWFQSEDNKDARCMGSMVISDFGLAEFHRSLSKKVAAQAVGVSGTYRAPEYDVPGQVSPSYDVWSLGCVLLEFVTWYILGWTAGVEAFQARRFEEGESYPNPEVGIRLVEDKFFNVFHRQSEVIASRKTSVTDVRSKFITFAPVTDRMSGQQMEILERDENVRTSYWISFRSSTRICWT